MTRQLFLLLSLLLFFDCTNDLDTNKEDVGYTDTSRFITTTKNEKPVDISLNGKEYQITEFDLFPHNNDFYPVFRIPSAVITKKNTILVACENREIKDDKGKIDIVLARKTDGNKEWIVKKVFEYNSITGRSMNPIFVIDNMNKRIYLFTCRLKDNSKWAVFHSTDEVDFVYKYSDDDGNTWSEEYSLKHLWDTSEYTAVIPSSCSGISDSNGMLLIPTMVIKDGDWRSGTLICKDGEWSFSKPTPNIGDNECTLYVDNKKRIVLDCRTYGIIRRRYFYDEFQNIFIETASSEIENCIPISASVVNDKGFFYMCFPDTDDGSRKNLTLNLSVDGIKWKKVYRIMDGYAKYGYSCVAISDDKMIVCYETYNGIYVQDLSHVRNVIRECQ